MKLAVVIPWFGRDLKGGAEQQAWQVATRLARRGVEVHALTTCSREFLSDWGQNHYSSGVRFEDEVVVHRFPVDGRDPEAFDRVNARLLALPRSELRPWVSPLNPVDERAYIDGNIRSSAFLNYLGECGEYFDAFLFLPYLFPMAIEALPLVRGKAVLQPCLHDESYAYLDCVRKLFTSAARLFFISEGEFELACRLYGSSIRDRSRVVGAGVETPCLLSGGTRDRPIVEGEYLLYLGRKDRGKNVHLLVEWFESCPVATEHSLKLVMAGPGALPCAPRTGRVIDLGVVSEEAKVNLLSGCKALVNLSENESFSRIVFEAWFSGKPVIVHDACLATSCALKAAGSAGWAVGNREDFDRCIGQMQRESDDGLAAMGQRGSRYAQVVADWDSVIERYLQELGTWVRERSPRMQARGRGARPVAIAYFSIGEGDAVGNDILQEYRVLAEEGYEVFLHADDYGAAATGGDVKRLGRGEFENFIRDRRSLLLYHHANYWERGEAALTESHCTVWLKYHNITPPEYFEKYSPALAESCRRGRAQSARLFRSGTVDRFLPDSRFNSTEILHCGVPGNRITVVPPFHRITDFCGCILNEHLLDVLAGGTATVLFVGRVAPNKGHRHLIEIVREYVRLFDRKISMNIVGGCDPALRPYLEELNGLVQGYGLSDCVQFQERVNFVDLHTFYQGSRVFLSMSEHEGFCVPILEAQYHRLPVIALDRGAVRATAGREQMILRGLDYSFLAGAVRSLAQHNGARGYLAQAGARNYRRYDFSELRNAFVRLISHA